jgi:hypothetical protein
MLIRCALLTHWFDELWASIPDRYLVHSREGVVQEAFDQIRKELGAAEASPVRQRTKGLNDLTLVGGPTSQGELTHLKRLALVVQIEGYFCTASNPVTSFQVLDRVAYSAGGRLPRAV